MALDTIWAVILLFSIHQVQSNVNKRYSKNPGFYYGNFKTGPKGFAINKTKDIVANITTASIYDCQIECIKHKGCLSLNAINRSSVQQCELFNWTSIAFTNHLIPEKNAYAMHIETVCEVDKPCKNGGECIANTGPYKYLCNCTNGYAGRNCDKKCILFDFETGRLDGWTLTGTAFNNQPTYGDNSKARNAAPSNHQGNWWIGSFENRPSPSHPAGAVQDNAPYGTMTSSPFIIQGTKIKFLSGGGADINIARVELLIGGEVVAKVTGANTEAMTGKTFDVVNYRGQVAQIRIVDQNTNAGWALINADYFQDSICTE